VQNRYFFIPPPVQQPTPGKIFVNIFAMFCFKYRPRQVSGLPTGSPWTNPPFDDLSRLGLQLTLVADGQAESRKKAISNPGIIYIDTFKHRLALG